MSITVLVLSAGDPAGVNFCSALRLCGNKYRIIACDTTIYRLHLALGDDRYLLPEPGDADYLAALQRVIDKTKPDFLYVSDTNAELEIVSRRRGDIAVKTFLPSQEAIELYEDKWASYLYFKAAGLPVPETVLVETPDDIDRALGAFGSIWLRAVRGSGGRGSIPTSSRELARAWIDRHDGWGDFTAAEVLTRRMCTWIGIWRHGELIVCQGRNRLHWEYGELSPSGVTGITGAQSTMSDPEIHSAALAAIHAIPHPPHALVSVDFTYDAHGRPNPTEIQASRFYSSINFLAQAGLNLPDIYVELGLNDRVPDLPAREHPLRDGLVWLKGVDCAPQLTTAESIEERRRQWTLLAPETAHG